MKRKGVDLKSCQNKNTIEFEESIHPKYVSFLKKVRTLRIDRKYETKKEKNLWDIIIMPN